MIDRGAITLVWSAIGETPPIADPVSEEELPPAFRALLTTRDGFTAALAARAGGAIGLDVLGSIRLQNRGLVRFSRLTRTGDGRTVALVGLVIDDPGALERDLFARVVAGREPFGTILADAGLVFHARTGGFFRPRVDPAIGDAGGTLFGRTAEIVGGDGKTIARVVEIPLED